MSQNWTNYEPTLANPILVIGYLAIGYFPHLLPATRDLPWHGRQAKLQRRGAIAMGKRRT